MLFNTAWNKVWNKQTEAKPADNIMSTARLVAWLERRPADKAYAYHDPHNCLLAQYFRENGEPYVRVGNYTAHNFGHGENKQYLPRAFQFVATQHPRTFGAALERAKALKQQGEGL